MLYSTLAQQEETGQAKYCNVTMRGFGANTVAVEKQ
jgi:hypothetical protein